MTRGPSIFTGRTRAIWTNVLLGTGTVLTALTGFVVGYGSVWFQIAGRPDAEDYQVSAGGYAAAALVLLVAMPAVIAARGAEVLLAGTAVVASLYLVLAVRSARLAAAVADGGPGINTARDGACGVLAMPWTWLLLVLGVGGSVHLLRRTLPSGRRRPLLRARPPRPSPPRPPTRCDRV